MKGCPDHPEFYGQCADCVDGLPSVGEPPEAGSSSVSVSESIGSSPSADQNADPSISEDVTLPEEKKEKALESRMDTMGDSTDSRTAATNEVAQAPLRTVAVFEHQRSRGRKPAFYAYVRDFNPAWDGCCLHRVRATSGAEAKREAIAFHKLKIGCEEGR